MSRFSAMNTTRHTDNAGAACRACAFSFVLMIIAGIAAAMPVLRISALLVLLAILCIMGMIIIMMSGNNPKRPEAMSQS